MKKHTLYIILLLLAGCSGQEEGTVILTQQVYLPEDDHDAINKNYSQLVDIQDDVARRYEIGSRTQKYVLKKTERLGSTLPRFNMGLDVTGAQINLNYSLFLANIKENNSKEAILGLVAHELAHAQHYHYFSLYELLQLAIRYHSYEKKMANSQWANWVRAYERFTDLQAIAYGYANPLVEQKRKTLYYLISESANEAQFYAFGAYLTEQEIIDMRTNPVLFHQALQETLTVLEWPIFSEIASHFPNMTRHKLSIE
ncbi:hypothetical protein [Endozoicomonas numazuensis]|uniref:Peptidase M48 domain-containing protein n=1 Tax=Endozoicomonas numazuensis TaxID=1137799 RepID=A0A081NCQ2_9GAMM|nr:hypothetical protein [Endozoicomonas numazuensis]KEQ16225.1 hypothetical protein GZ78_23660 [Endozoicomonas numazuensis]